MLVAEELLLLGLDPTRGSVVNGGRTQLVVGLGGALVAELALLDAVHLDRKRFAVSGPPPADPLLALVHRELASRKGRRASDQLRRLDRAVGGLWSGVVDRLVGQGVLGRRRDRVLLVPVTRHPVLRGDLRDEVLARVRAAATGDGEIEPRTAIVLSLSGPSRLLEVVARDRADRRHARARIRAAGDLTPVTPAVRTVLAEAASVVVVIAAGADGGGESGSS